MATRKTTQQTSCKKTADTKVSVATLPRSNKNKRNNDKLIQSKLQDNAYIFESKLTDIAKQTTIFLKLNKRFIKDCNAVFRIYQDIGNEYLLIKRKMLQAKSKSDRLSSVAIKAIKQDAETCKRLQRAINIINQKNQEIQFLTNKIHTINH